MMKLLKGLSLIAAVAAIAGGATYAYFSDVETSTGNTITAGTLDLSADGNNGTQPVKFTLGVNDGVVPGGHGTIKYALKNEGDVPGYIDVHEVTVVNTEGLNPEPETNTTGAGELGSHVNVVVTVGGSPIYSGTLDGFVANDGNKSIPLAAGGTADAEIAWSWPDGGASDNDAMGDVATVGMTFELGQEISQ